LKAKSKFFQGEVMTCDKCKRSEKSDTARQSGWTVIEIEGEAIYICPACFGNIPDYWARPYWARH
jgi:hypothetical protein